jgi:hypothetical protein
MIVIVLRFLVAPVTSYLTVAHSNSYGVCGDEDEAATICGQIHDRLKKSMAPTAKPEIKKLGETVNMKARVEQQNEHRKTVRAAL